jgi:predicted Rossmann-fold nucleotide-binding protein
MLDESKGGQPDSGGAVSLADEDRVREILIDTMFGLWSTVNNLSRLRPTKDDRFRVTIFGSARIERDSWIYEEVRRTCAGLGEMGCDIITGGGPGLMEAANLGATEGQATAGAQSIGIRVHLPFEQDANPFVQQTFRHGTFFTRLHQFVLMSNAYVVAPGGIGTLLETAMIWQLLQVRQLDAPLVLVGPMWRSLIDWAHAEMLRPGLELASAGDFDIPVCVDTADEALSVIRKHHFTWMTRNGKRSSRS